MAVIIVHRTDYIVMYWAITYRGSRDVNGCKYGGADILWIIRREVTIELGQK